MLGHVSAKMTLDVYGSLFEEDLESLALIGSKSDTAACKPVCSSSRPSAIPVEGRFTEPLVDIPVDFRWSVRANGICPFSLCPLVATSIARGWPVVRPLGLKWRHRYSERKESRPVASRPKKRCRFGHSPITLWKWI